MALTLTLQPFIYGLATLFRVSIPPAAYSFATDGSGIFKVCTHVGVCRMHVGVSYTNKSAQELIHRDKNRHGGLVVKASAS